MGKNSRQIYSATYSNVPVFEYVTLEGPVMRRKLDSWINATHILKTARFPKAKRTRILEKDVQTGIHEKVQGGYGKYQGTYVPLELGAEIARSFGVFEVLEPIFEFRYVEGQSETPPPAPKHNHLSASNFAKKQANISSQNKQGEEELPTGNRDRKNKSSLPEERPRKRGRPKRMAFSGDREPNMEYSDTTPLSSKSEMAPEGKFYDAKQTPTLERQSTIQDLQQITPRELVVDREDLVVADNSSDIDETKMEEGTHRDDESELMSGKELFGSPRNSFERIVQSHNQGYPSQLLINSSIQLPYGLLQYNSHLDVEGPTLTLPMKEDYIYSEYFINLLNFFLKDESARARASPDAIPEKIMHPPQPLSKINITQTIDEEGNTIFHWACSMANTTMIEFLLNVFHEFLSPNLKNNNGETPLMFLVKFSNAFQLKNFPELLDLLSDGILSIDYSGKTVLHHIALVGGTDREGSINEGGSIIGNVGSRKNREKFAKYYLECVLAKVEQMYGDGDHKMLHRFPNETDKFESTDDIISKFINHQDLDGNTAFHLVSYALNKKCIRTFLNFRKYINFLLKNLVAYTAEDYLASHNYLLRLDVGNNGNDISNEKLSEGERYSFNSKDVNTKANSVESIEFQFYLTKLAHNLHSRASNLITEKLAELTYYVDKELRHQDDNIVRYYKLLKEINTEKQQSQRQALELFRLDYILDNLSREYILSLDSSNVDLNPMDKTKDNLIQEEINRLVSDLSFQILCKREDFIELMNKYKDTISRLCHARIKTFAKQEVTNITEKDEENLQPREDNNKLELAKELQQQIIFYNSNVAKLRECAHEAPYKKDSVDHKDDNGKREIKENKENLNDFSQEPHGTADISRAGQVFPSISSEIDNNDNLHKYCRLIALCCGLDIEEVKDTIDLIEQSLSESKEKPDPSA